MSDLLTAAPDSAAATTSTGALVRRTQEAGASALLRPSAIWTTSASRRTTPLNGDGTVTDDVTKVVWQQVVSPNVYEWADAQAYCANLNLAGTGWRLPTLSELFSIEERGPSVPFVDQTAFPNMPIDSYWTSTLYEAQPDYAWYDYFAVGGPYFGHVETSLFVRCAR